MTLRARGPMAGGVLLAVLAAAALLLATREPAPPFIDQPAPAFELPRLDLPGARLGPAQMLGQVWVLNVWASWCAPCRDEHPLLLGLARDSGVPLVGLNYKDDPRDAQEWLRRGGNPYVASAVDRDGRTGVDYGVRGVPETLLIDRAGVVRHRHAGPLTQQVWAQEWMPLIQRLRDRAAAP